ncbi:peptide ABC transporter substrate-binding protein [Anaerorhabdus furcosa]|uniref:Oligopeptide transport system substrate-binding protein n=1 Tax=Anaerorhabdus furcosa TaxID=118967 RepID=A0A1T4JX84_9FIRM|nr:peptide ABC transporter substrate-binding protein [Anaerorhabdus furcosa]SJZ34738.1 oligopeptide transport system substrate-binding protein [Anaerorhabdus furcosa]
MKKLKLLIVSTLVFALVAGCSSKPATNGGTEGGNTDGTGNSKVVVATDTDLSTMDHHLATDGTSFIAQTLVFSGLTELDENNMPIPEIAESWDINEDGTVYTFHLADAKWSNGTPVTANDFVYGWQRLIDQATASEYAFILSTITLKNADAVAAGELPLEELGVKALDDKTLEVTLDAPCDFLLGLLAFPSFFPLNQEYYEAQGDQYAKTPQNMIYNGPYLMTAWTPGNSYAFTKNNDYFKADTIDVNDIDFKFIQDTQSAMLEYQSGNLDVVKLSGEMVDAYKDQEGFTNRLQGYLWYLSLNFDIPELQNQNLRKAMMYAVDRETIANNVLKDGSVAADGIIPIELATGPDGKEYRATAGKITEYDPAKAKEYYEKAKADLGKDVTIDLLFEDTEAGKSVAEYIQNNLETNCPGMTVTLNSKPKKTRLQMMQNGEYQVALHRWGPDYADPQTYLDLFLVGASNNYGKYESQAYQDLVLEATQGESAKDSQARWDLLVQAEKVLVGDDAGVIPVYQNGGAMMITPAVEGIEFHSAGVDSYRHMTRK